MREASAPRENAGRQSAPRAVPGDRPLVLVRGAGDFASGIIHRLYMAGFRVVATEIEKPLAVRRKVAFSEAVYEGTWTVEGVTAGRCSAEEIEELLASGIVPVVVDPEGRILERGFDVVVDARSAKRNLGTTIGDAPVVVAIGPGFTAGIDCHAVVETLAGGGLGKVIYEGSAAPDTGSPQPAAGPCACAFCVPEEVEVLLLRSPSDGVIRVIKDIGSRVETGETLARIGSGGREIDVVAPAPGMIRGMIHNGTPVKKGMKIGDIDPTADERRCCEISEKSRAIAGGVLEACLALLSRAGRPLPPRWISG